MTLPPRRRGALPRPTRRLLAALATTLAVAASGARAGIVAKVRDNGPDENRVVMVLLAEGYSAAEQARFDSDAAATLADFFRAEPWASYEGHVNVYTDFVASVESGADKPAPCFSPEVFKDTAFDARYCGYGTRRLLVVDEGRAWVEATTAVPGVDLVGVQVNDTEYGGAGGSVLTFSMNAGARSEIFLHEAGHTFPGLADEYTTPYPGFPPGDGEPNVDFDSVRGGIDWDPWIDAATPLPTPPAMTTVVGAFEGARYQTAGIFRPMADCKMRTLNKPFCPVCAEAIVQTIYLVTSPIDGATPSSDTAPYDPCDAAGSVTLAVTPVLPAEPSWITAAWELDGAALGETSQTLTLPIASLGGVVHEVACTLRDTTPLVRRTYRDPMTATRTWSLQPALGADRDADGVGDGCDCAPDDPSASSPPSTEVGLLRVDRPGRLSWAPVAASHDVARGLVADLAPSGAHPGSCLAADGSGTLDDADRPGSARCFWYLVRGRNACGTAPWGPRSDGRPRAVGACP